MAEGFQPSLPSRAESHLLPRLGALSGVVVLTGRTRAPLIISDGQLGDRSDFVGKLVLRARDEILGRRRPASARGRPF